MAKGEIIIDERYCKGCGYCAYYCRRHCIVIPGDRFTPQGYLLPVFARPEKCNACGVCGWLCPHFALEVYRVE
jgi:2-oxoglutarate ferredoxin oxidoreductase subunit delta